MMMAAILLAWCFHAELKGDYLPASWSGVEVSTNAIPGNPSATSKRLTRDLLHAMWCTHESYLQHKYFGMGREGMSLDELTWTNRVDSNRWALPSDPSLGSLLGAGLAENITNIEVELHNDYNPAVCSVWGDAGYLLPSNGYWSIEGSGWWAPTNMISDLVAAWDSNWVFWPVNCTKSYASWIATRPDHAKCVFDDRVLEQFLENLNLAQPSIWNLKDRIHQAIQARYDPQTVDPHEQPFYRYGRPRDMPYMQDIYCRLRHWPDTSWAWSGDWSRMAAVETNLTAIGKDVDTRRFDLDLWANMNYCIGPLRYLCQYKQPNGYVLAPSATWRKVTTAGSSGWFRPAELANLESIYIGNASRFDAQGVVTFSPGEATVHFGNQESMSSQGVYTNMVHKLERRKIMDSPSWWVSPITLAKPCGMTPYDLEVALGSVAYTGDYTMAEYSPVAQLTGRSDLNLYWEHESLWTVSGGLSKTSFGSDEALTLTGGSAADVVGDTSGRLYLQENVQVWTNGVTRLQGYRLDAADFSDPSEAWPQQGWMDLQTQMDAEIAAAVSGWSAGTVTPPSTMDLSSMSHRFSSAVAAQEYVTNYVSHILGPDLTGMLDIRWLHTDYTSLNKLGTAQDDGKILDIAVPAGWTVEPSCDVAGFCLQVYKGSTYIDLLFAWADPSAQPQDLRLAEPIRLVTDDPGYDAMDCVDLLEQTVTATGRGDLRTGTIDYKPGEYMRVNGVDYLGLPDGDFVTFGFEVIDYNVVNPGGNAAGIHYATNLTVDAEASMRGIAIISPPDGYFSLEAR